MHITVNILFITVFVFVVITIIMVIVAFVLAVIIIKRLTLKYFHLWFVSFKQHNIVHGDVFDVNICNGNVPSSGNHQPP